jgi:hypothetical protein
MRAASSGYPAPRRARPALAKPDCLCKERAFRCGPAADCKRLDWLSSTDWQGKLTPRMQRGDPTLCGGPGAAAVVHNWAALGRRVREKLATHYPARAAVSGRGFRAGNPLSLAVFLLCSMQLALDCGVTKRARFRLRRTRCRPLRAKRHRLQRGFASAGGRPRRTRFCRSAAAPCRRWGGTPRCGGERSRVWRWEWECRGLG